MKNFPHSGDGDKEDPKIGPCSTDGARHAGWNKEGKGCLAMRKVIAVGASFGACLVVASSAFAAPPGPPPGLNSGPPAPIVAPFAPGNGADGVSASAPMTLQCGHSPAMDAAVAVNPPANAAALQALCRQTHAPGPPAMTTALRSRRHRTDGRFHKYTPSLCGNAGCAYIWLYNLHNSYAEAEYEAAPSRGSVQSGTAYFTRYTQSNNSYAAWSDSMASNCGVSWCGYRYLYPIANTSNSWVHVNGSGTAVLTVGFASWGPVDTWNYITHG